MVYVDPKQVERLTRRLDSKQIITLLVGEVLFFGIIFLPWSRQPPDTYRYTPSGRRVAAWSKPVPIPVGLPLSLLATVIATTLLIRRLRSSGKSLGGARCQQAER